MLLRKVILLPRSVLVIYIIAVIIITFSACDDDEQYLIIRGKLQYADGAPASSKELHLIEADVGAIHPFDRDRMIKAHCSELSVYTSTESDGRFEIKLLRKTLNEKKELILGIKESKDSNKFQALCFGPSILKLEISPEIKKYIIESIDIDDGIKCNEISCSEK